MFRNETNYVLTNGVLLDGTEKMTPQTGRDIYIEGGRIGAVADAGFVVLVMGLELLGALQDLLVQRVLDAVLNSDNDGLVHLVGNDLTNADLTGGNSLLFHLTSPPSHGSWF